jgi:SAM-dependent methyltransferase
MERGYYRSPMANFDTLRRSFVGTAVDSSNWSDLYTADHRYHELYDLVVRLAESDTTILEVGAAPFHFQFLLEREGYEVIGLDLNPSRYESYIQKHALCVEECDIETERFPLSKNSVSIVLFSEVLEHLRKNPLHTVNEISRVLKPNGYLLLTTPNAHAIFDFYRYLLGNGIAPPPTEEYSMLDDLGHMGHVRHWATPEVKDLLRSRGIKVMSVTYRNWHRIGENPTLKLRLAELLTGVIPRLRRYQLILARNSAESPHQH